MKVAELIAYLLEHQDKEIHIAGVERDGRKLYEADMRPLRHVHTEGNKLILLYDLDDAPEEE